MGQIVFDYCTNYLYTASVHFEKVIDPTQHGTCSTLPVWSISNAFVNEREYITDMVTQKCNSVYLCDTTSRGVRYEAVTLRNWACYSFRQPKTGALQTQVRSWWET
jgi:hypothetical protein